MSNEDELAQLRQEYRNRQGETLLIEADFGVKLMGLLSCIQMIAEMSNNLKTLDLPSVNKAVDNTMAKGDSFNYCYRLAADPHKVIRGIGRVTYNKDTGKPERMIGVCVESSRTEQRCLLDCPLAKKAHEKHDPDQFKMEFEFCAS